MVKGNKELEPVTRDYTIHLHKRLHGIDLKKRAPRAIREIKNYTSRVMKTKDVRIDHNLNNFIWSRGIKGVPFRVRVRMQRKRNEEETAGDSMYTLVRYLPVDSFRGLRPEKVDSE